MEARSDLFDLAAEHPPRVEEVVADRGLAAVQDRRDLARVQVFHLTQDEGRFLLSGQPSRDSLEETRGQVVLRGPRRFISGLALAQAHQVQSRRVGPLAAARGSQEVDRQVGGDPVEPGVEGVRLVVPGELFPDAEKGYLRHVTGILYVAHDAAGDGNDGRRLTQDEDLERQHIPRAGGDGELPVGKLPAFLAAAILAVNELHSFLIRRRPGVRWRLFVKHKPLNCKLPVDRVGDNCCGMFLYRVLSVLALLIYSPYALLRSVAGRRRLGDIRGRLGLAPIPDLDGGIWVHAGSVGEVSVARNLLAGLSPRAPGARLGLSVTTAAGLEAARPLTGQGIAVFSFPLDLAGPVEKALSAARPGLILLTETELWPLLLERARAGGVPVALVNGRISDRSYRRYLLLRGWFRRVLENISLFAMQTDEDARRIERLGARPERILVTGNIKYDLASAAPFADAARLSTAAAGRPILVARRPERFDDVAALVERSGFRLIRRSQAPAASLDTRLSTLGSRPDIYLLDSIGELASVYAEASLAFLGGSLIATGGHNPIEAWAQGVAVLVGPHTGNFREITQAGQRLGILESVADARELSRAFDLALKDQAGTSARGDHARRFVAESRGAAASTADSVVRLLPPGRHLSGG